MGIVTELTDNQGREISFGSATYDFHTIGTWRDKQICSVIRGQNGFAAVHYTIFTDAVLAKLSFKIVYNFESGGATKVHGIINTWYSNSITLLIMPKTITEVPCLKNKIAML